MWLGAIPESVNWLKKDQLGSLYYKNKTLRQLVYDGVPNALRGNLWLLWSGARFKVSQYSGQYADILKYYEGQPSIATKEIDKVT